MAMATGMVMATAMVTDTVMATEATATEAMDMENPSIEDTAMASIVVIVVRENIERNIRQAERIVRKLRI